jgi:uroporphyrinogen-III synthase
MPAKKMVLVTRPQAQAASWVLPLRAAGWDASALPLIDVLPASDQDAVLQAWQNLAQWHAVMFVSSNAVEQFFAAKPQQLSANGGAWPRWWVTGPGSLQALLQQSGVQPSEVDCPPADAAQFDSEALWAHVQGQVTADFKVLIVRGVAGGRDWLQQRLVAAGATVTVLAAYQRVGPDLDIEQRAVVHHAAQCGAIWVFSSAQAIHHLRSSFPMQQWQACCALVTHPRIGQVAADAGFGQVLASRPAVSDMLACLETVP